ncbi:MAG: phosphoglucosamine mutase, partial [Muribaculaceae bacterium]|nr:phosphoglucosamine mutase [Muribaculaceae bacterium]
MALIKSISGIRGTIGGRQGEGLNPVDIARFASAYGMFIKSNAKTEDRVRVVVGRDARISGPLVSELVIQSLLATGVDVIDIDLASTPTTEIAVVAEKANGGIIITASHNPRHWNALKLLNDKGEFLNAEEGQEVLRIADSGEMIFAYVDNVGHRYKNTTYNL